MLALTAVAGCGSKPEQPRSAGDVLLQMADAYRQATTYSDQAVERVQYTADGKPVDQAFPCSVVFERPNKLRMRTADAQVACDGSIFQAYTEAQANKVLQVEAPAKLALGGERMLSTAMTHGMGVRSIQLVLLLDDHPLDAMLDGLDKPTLGEPAKIDDALCDRVQAKGPGGTLVLWIDQTSHALRRLELPIDDRRAELEVEAGRVEGLSHVIDFKDAKFSAPSDAAAYRLEIPAGAQLVDRLFDSSSGGGAGDVPAASQPKAVTLTKLWAQSKVEFPMNILVREAAEGWRVLAINDGTSVVELGSDGEIVASHDLNLPRTDREQPRVMFLQETVTADGKRLIAGWWPGQQQVHVFDESFALQWSYPKAVSAGGISDVLWADLNGDKQPELNVGYYDVVGVQNVGLDGTMRWWKKKLVNVLRLATEDGLKGPFENLLVTADPDRGKIIVIDQEGEATGTIDVQGRFISAVYRAEFEDKSSHYLGIAPTAPGRNDVIGMDTSGAELWSVRDLNFQPYQEHILAGDFLADGTKQWLVATSEGTIRAISKDGKVVDEFNYGSPITGLAMTSGSKPVLIVSSRGRIEAFSLEAAKK